MTSGGKEMEIPNEAITFDLEANGLLDTMDHIHCIAHAVGNRAATLSTTPSDVLEKLENAPMLIGHNIQAYDIPAIQLIHPTWKPKGIIRDTLVMSRLQRVHSMMRHSLEAWGKHLKFAKGDFGKETDWQTYTPEMGTYCIQDVDLNVRVARDLFKEDFSLQSIELEHEFSKLLDWQMKCGVPFDEETACALANELTDLESTKRLSITSGFPEWDVPFLPKRDNSTRGYKKGVIYMKKKPFNVGSRQQVVEYLKMKHNWVPTDFTDKGNPQVSGDVLRKLPYDEAPTLAEYFDVKKLLGQVMTGKGSWLNNLKDGRIYGFINHNGAVTGRCTHSGPNLAQVPAARAFKGSLCRSLFQAEKGYSMVGCDASGLELRNLAHYMAAFDMGSYANIICDGDIHTANQEAAGLGTRDEAKTFIYAHNYGAGDAKLGSIMDPLASEGRRRSLGRTARTKFLTRIPALRQVISQVKQVGARRGFLYGLDGRKLHLRSEHKALNTLLQGAGAVIMKQAMVTQWKEAGLAGIPKEAAYPVLHIHDEMQSIVRHEYVEQFKEIAVESIREAGRIFDYKCPLDGEAKHGNSWADTH